MTTNENPTAPISGRQLRKGMILGGRTVSRTRTGVGSAKHWVYIEYADGRPGDRDRVRVGDRLDVVIPA
jgi:hypothetical protein